MLETEHYGVNVFEHKRNIRLGKGRIIYGPAVIDISGRAHPAGWVLPGGVRIQDEAAAHAAALALDHVIRANGG